MNRIFRTEFRRQLWFVAAVVLSVVLVALIDTLNAVDYVPASNVGDNGVTLFLFLVWGAWVALQERDRERTNALLLSSSVSRLWLARMIPGILTAVATGVISHVLTHRATVAAIREGTVSQARMASLSSVFEVTATLALPFAFAFIGTLIVTVFSFLVNPGVFRRLVVAGTWLIVIAHASVAPLFMARRYEASTGFGRSHAAVRAAAPNADVSVQETSRMAREVVAPDNIERAVAYLANAEKVRSALETAMHSPLIAPGTQPNYATTSESVDAASARLAPDTLKALREDLPRDAWTDFIYLDAIFIYDNDGRDRLRPERVKDTVNDLLVGTSVLRRNSREVVLTVRNGDARFAEVMASAITAAYQQTYQDRLRSRATAAVKGLVPETRRARRDLKSAQHRLELFRNSHSDVILPEQASSAVRSRDETRQEVDASLAALAVLDSRIAAGKARPSASGRNTPPGNAGTQFAEPTDSLCDLVEQRAGLAARLEHLSSVLAQKSSVVASLPGTAATATRLASDVATAAKRYRQVTARLTAAQDELVEIDTYRCLDVRFWSGINNSSFHPEAPARDPPHGREGSWGRVITLLLVGGFSAKLLGAAAVGTGHGDNETAGKGGPEENRIEVRL